jgi:hypothetical protein
MKIDPAIKTPLMVLCGLVLIFAVCISFLYPIFEDGRCDNKGGDANIPSKYSFSEGCMFLIDGLWVPEAKAKFPPTQVSPK